MSGDHISAALRTKVAASAGNRCGYCLSAQQYVMGKLEIEHLLPRARGGTSEESNLWLACSLCNDFKKTQVDGIDPNSAQRAPLFNPRFQSWKEHFKWAEDGVQIVGLTSIGRATVLALKLNNLLALSVRRAWVDAGWHPPP